MFNQCDDILMLMAEPTMITTLPIKFSPNFLAIYMVDYKSKHDLADFSLLFDIMYINVLATNSMLICCQYLCSKFVIRVILNSLIPLANKQVLLSSISVSGMKYITVVTMTQIC